MYYISNTTTRNRFKSACAAQVRNIYNRISIMNSWRGTTVSHQFTEFNSLSVSQNFCGSEELTIGSFPMNEFSAEIINTEGVTAWRGAVVLIECGVRYYNDDILYVPVGRFKVTEAKTKDDWKTVSLKGYDISSEWNDNVTVTASNAWAAIEELTNGLGVTVVPDASGSAGTTKYILEHRTLSDSDKQTLSEQTRREAIATLSGLAGANAHLSIEGKLYIARFINAQYAPTITKDVQWQSGFEDKNDNEPITISSITSNDNEGENESYTAGTGTGITFQNALIKHAEITAIKDIYNGLTYLPCSVEWFGDPRIEAGDIVTAEYGSTTTNVYVAHQTLDLVGGLSMMTESPQATKEFNFSTDIDKKLQVVKRQYQEAIKKATDAINGNVGGYVKITDTDNDGNPDEIRILQNEDGSGKVIKMNASGIGYSSNGGVSYTTAITGEGIVAAAITVGKLTASQIDLDGVGAGIVIGKNQVTGLTSDLSTLTSGVATATANASAAVGTADAANANASAAVSATESIKQTKLARYLTCATAASTANKECYLPDTQDYTVGVGATITVKFTHTGYYTESTLYPKLYLHKQGSTDVISSGHDIYYNGAMLTSKDVAAWSEGATVSFIYDGTRWVMQDNVANTILSDWCMANDRTYIDGSNIYTGTLNANAISTGIIVKRDSSGNQDGTSYLDLTNDKFVAGASNGYKTEISFNGIEQFSDGLKVGDLSPVKAGSVRSVMLAYNPTNAESLNLGYESGGGFIPILSLKNDSSNGSRAICDTTAFSGYVSRRTFTVGGSSVTREAKCGVGSATYNNTAYTSASIECSYNGTIYGRLDCIGTGGGYGAIRTQSGGAQSHWLYFGEDLRWNGSTIITANNLPSYSIAASQINGTLAVANIPYNDLYKGRDLHLGGGSREVVIYDYDGTQNDTYIRAYIAESKRGIELIYRTYYSSGASELYSLRPIVNGNVGLGSANFKWGQIYSTNGSISTSDRNEKNTINNIDEKYEKLFDLLRPVTYKMNGRTRIHTGFIAQDVEDAMKSLNIPSLDFAALCKDAIDENGAEMESNEENYQNADTVIYGLRYEEFIALCVDKIQKLDRRVKELERINDNA